jgi:WhiB family transcriptional regulator, redox-sensing transcriptional regulator
MSALIESTRNADWLNRGACLNEDPDLFFPVGTTGPALVQIAQAKAVCRTCPVMEACLEWAVAKGVTDGVWGALATVERQSLKRRRDRQARQARLQATERASEHPNGCESN